MLMCVDFIRDDVVTSIENFGDIPNLLWDNSTRVRAAAARHVYEDSFVVEDGNCKVFDFRNLHCR